MCRTLVQTTVISRLDYANALLIGVPKTLLYRLQLVQNSCARLITRTKRWDHISPVLVKLHWLPIESRIAYKVILYTYKAIKNRAPSYICNLVEKYKPSRELRSMSQSVLKVPIPKTVTYGSRSFRVAASQLWNTLPNHVKDAASIDSFKRQLKTHLFTKAYSDYLWTF